MSTHPGITETGHYGVPGHSLVQRIEASQPVDRFAPPPRRALRVVLDAHADTIDDLESIFASVIEGLRRSPSLTGTTSGAPSYGYHFEVERRAITPDQYAAELAAYIAERRATTAPRSVP